MLALGAAVLLWASFALTVRGIGGSGLTAMDAALLRFGTPVVLLSPWLPRAVRAVRRERPTTIAALLLAGLPHYLLSALGGRLASAAVVGLLLPGTVPLFVALLKRDRRRWPALAAILLGVAVLTVAHAGLAGIAVLLAAGLAWAVYTMALSRTGLDLISLVLVVCTPSALIALAGSAHLKAAPAGTIVLFVVLQGVGTGIVSTLSYAYAVRRLGSSIPAVTGALSPVLTTLLAVPIFGEGLTAGAAVALLLIVGGVVAYNAPQRQRLTTPAAALRSRTGSRRDPWVAARTVDGVSSR
ncbi:hypothetical protein ACWT_2978 [Actinoplanes sp. SE50]|nr:hypothetical protein ACPL_3105 [Actinoplanes sp. SE50/110]ATO82393.1 hypothetical protein ACWT_2978 [Actinoplanes sp. SE50]SLL99800.1 hypothetical protein ACSP50_3032 [Actinoplanes sp. SE50/110]